MRHLFKAIFFLCMCQLSMQASTQFQRRFGPDSPIYNTPLYFTQKRKNVKKLPVKKGSYREQIRKKLKQKSSKKKQPTPKRIAHKNK